MDNRVKTALIVVGIAVAAYLGYRWWENRKASGSPTGALGTNLNSVAPELIGGSSGPNSGLDYSPQPANVTVNYPSQITNSASPQPTSAGVTTGNPIITQGNFG